MEQGREHHLEGEVMKISFIFVVVAVFSFSLSPLQANEYQDTQGWYDEDGKMMNDNPTAYPYSPRESNSLEQNPINLPGSDK
jgi:hypothetical protein